LGVGPAAASAPAATAAAQTSPAATAARTGPAAEAAGAPAASEDIRDTYRERVAQYLETVTGGWDDDVVAIAPEAVGNWDDRQQAMIDARIGVLEDAGWTVRIAVLPPLSYPYDAGLDPQDADAGLQRGLT